VPVQIAIDHVNVTVPVGATAEVVAFYVEVLDFEPVERPPGGRHAGAWLQVDADTQLHLSEHAAPPNPQAHFAVRVSDYAAVEAAIERVAAPWEPLADRGRGRRMLVRDPAGNGVEICETT